MYFPYLLYGCNLEINEARLAAYLERRCDVCNEDEPAAHIQVKSNCDILGFTLDDDGTTVIPVTYDTPAADAPWVDASQPESARFMGFRIENITRPVNISRQISAKISGSGGGVLETLRPRAQVYEIELLMFACDEQAMEFGFRYLTSGLAGEGCDDPCTLCDLEYRETCVPFEGATPTLDEYNKGRWILKNVGVTSAPEWLDPPVRGLEYMVRRVKFSIASETPWKFHCPVVCTEGATFPLEPQPPCGLEFEKFFCDKTEVSCAMTEPSVVGETAFIMELRAGSQPLSGVEVRIIPDEYGWVCDPGSAPAGFNDPDPCDIIYIEEIPANHVLVYDSSIEKVVMVTNTGAQIDGTPYLAFDTDGRAPSYPTVRCGQFCIKVLVDECSVSSGAAASIWTVHREF